jgi:chorismate mutase
LQVRANAEHILLYTLLTTVIMMSESTVCSNKAHWQELDEWRKKIDAIDQQLSTLLCERLLCAQNISSLKSRIGEQVLQPEREKEVLSNVLSHADSPLKSHALEKIYRCIIDETRLFQHEWKNNQPGSQTS